MSRFFLNFGSRSLHEKVIPIKVQSRSRALEPKVIFGKAEVSLTISRAGAGLHVSGLGPRQGVIIGY